MTDVRHPTLGDLVATCSSPLSRNRTFGERLGRGESLAQAEAANHGQVAEGVKSCTSVCELGERHGVELPIGEMFFRNKGVRGGSAPARAYIPELLPDVLDGRINPGRVLDYSTDLEGIADAYAAMDERRAIKSLVRVGSV